MPDWLKPLLERQRAHRVRPQGEEPRQSVHQTHPVGVEGPRCGTSASVEATYRKRSAEIVFRDLLNSNLPQRFTSGDFSSILHEVISKRSSVIKGTLTIDDLNRYLDEITENIGKQDKQSKVLQKIYNRATPNEQRWIVRIILKGGHTVLS